MEGRRLACRELTKGFFVAGKQVLITGGSGYLGLSLARKFLEAGDKPVTLCIHAAGDREFQAKRRRIERQLKSFGDRVRYHGGDLGAARPFESIDPGEVAMIIHAAAVTRFNVDLESARGVNVEGSEKVLRLAAGCPSLEAIGLFSTVYASGLTPGVIEEQPLDDAFGFANHYERSKWETESLLLRQFNDLPWRLFRIATVIAADDRGRVEQHNAFHNTLRLFYYGLQSFIPGKPATPLYFVTEQFVTDAVFALMRVQPERTIYHVSPGRRESLTLGELIDIAFETFEQDREFKNRRVLKPLYSDEESFRLLAEGLGSFDSSVMFQTVSSVLPFARQLFVDKEIKNQRLVSALSEVHFPEPCQLAQRTCEFLVQSRWGKRSAHEHS
jgi:nucleoside-diphosphate-sugar epimerase